MESQTSWRHRFVEWASGHALWEVARHLAITIGAAWIGSYGVPWEFRSWMGNRASTYHENRKISDCAGHLEIQMRRPDPWMERTGQRLSKCTQE